MRAFQVLWTPPLLERTWAGLKVEVPPRTLEEMFSDYYILTMLLGLVQWKRLNGGTLKLYGDERVIEYFSRFDLLELWDDHDGETLVGLDKHIDRSCFYSAGKFYAYLKEQAPCVLLDLDLVFWRPVEFRPDDAVVFTHWEDTNPATYFYAPPETLKTPPGYHFRPGWDWSLMAANTSLVYFGDDEFKNHYANEVIRFMVDNHVGGEFHLIKPELLFIEQRLMPMCLNEWGLLERSRPLIDTVWSPTEGRFTRHDPRLGEWHYLDLENQPLVTHLWIAKKYIEENPEYRAGYCRRVLGKLLALKPDLEPRLAAIGPVRQHMDALVGAAR